MCGGRPVRIYKYPLFDIRHLIVDGGVFVQIDLPINSLGLSSQLQGFNIVHYVAVDPHETRVQRYTWYVIGTGYDMDRSITADDYVYKGSFVHAEYGLVAHLFLHVNQEDIEVALYEQLDTRTPAQPTLPPPL